MKRTNTDRKTLVNPKLLLAHAEDAEKQVETARKHAKSAKANYRKARKALKQVKKAAKEAWKLAKAAVKKLKPGVKEVRGRRKSDAKSGRQPGNRKARLRPAAVRA